MAKALSRAPPNRSDALETNCRTPEAYRPNA